ncbi:hypothetical protein [Craterilacuibacter sp.]|uniref:hypothetical protein n=1 Tax=Craterilacuibacter sp. TaxID=2870909 RepID=UPI003F41A6AB
MFILYSQALSIIQIRYHKLPCPGRLGVSSFKKDRGLWLDKLPDGRCRVSEFGFQSDSRIIDADQLAALLKRIIKREFPRSYKLRLEIQSED